MGLHETRMWLRLRFEDWDPLSSRSARSRFRLVPRVGVSLALERICFTAGLRGEHFHHRMTGGRFGCEWKVRDYWRVLLG